MRLITTGFELQKSFMLAVGLYKQRKEKNLVFQTQARKKGQMLTHSTLQHSPKCNSNSMPSMYSVQTELVASQQREFHT